MLLFTFRLVTKFPSPPENQGFSAPLAKMRENTLIGYSRVVDATKRFLENTFIRGCSIRASINFRVAPSQFYFNPRVIFFLWVFVTKRQTKQMEKMVTYYKVDKERFR